MTRAVYLPRRGVLGAMIGGLLLGGGGAGRGMRDAEGLLFAYCSRLGCPPALGRACIEALPEPEAARGALVGGLLRGLGQRARRGASVGALAQELREQSRADFAHGRVMHVRGWMLSRTEVRVYALTTLRGAAKA